MNSMKKKLQFIKIHSQPHDIRINSNKDDLGPETKPPPILFTPKHADNAGCKKKIQTSIFRHRISASV